MSGKIIVIVVIIITLGAALYLYHLGTTGGLSLPSLPGFSSSSFSFLPSFKAGESGPQTPAGSPGQTYISQTSGTGSGNAAPSIYVDTSAIPAAEIPAGFTASELSPYFDEVRFSDVSPSSYGSYGTISLVAQFANYNATGTIDITGWQIKTDDGGEYIPGAIDVYDPSGLTPASDIRLQNGDTVYLYSSSAPFNLRLNECIGYISNIANFEPALPQDCAAPDESMVQNFTGACREYIQSLGGCSQPQLPNPLVAPTDYECQDFLQNNFTYKSCFEQHSSDPDFLSNEVWVWTGSNVVNQYHDTVDLLDKNGLLVAQESY